MSAATSDKREKRRVKKSIAKPGLSICKSDARKGRHNGIYYEGFTIEKENGKSRNSAAIVFVLFVVLRLFYDYLLSVVYFHSYSFVKFVYFILCRSGTV